MRVLITGGAGFIGTHLTKALASRDHEVTILDCLSEQVHGAGAGFPGELKAVAHCIHGDVRDKSAVSAAIRGQEAIVHFAAETGTGQSMYQIHHYADVNLMGTAALLEELAKAKSPSLRKIVVASSRAVYGEGKYHCPEHGTVYPKLREVEDLEQKRFDPTCPICRSEVQVLATAEDAPFAPTSFYGLSKQVQEQMVLMFSKVMGVGGIALRYQNVYGPGQSLTNPYTGILAIFSNLAKLAKPINVFEDGRESRDFVYIDDVVQATLMCVEGPRPLTASFNVGSGVSTDVASVAASIVERLRSTSTVAVSGNYRVGDIRHNVADLSLIRSTLGFEPTWRFQHGIAKFLDWSLGSTVEEEHFDRSLEELRERGLLGGEA